MQDLQKVDEPSGLALLSRFLNDPNLIMLVVNQHNKLSLPNIYMDKYVSHRDLCLELFVMMYLLIVIYAQFLMLSMLLLQ